ncbi:hypothetical protein RJ639_001876 [Escallonia herrerae]|uniref:DYW domain-containing protein n=1 Tax=Escallonia herrerae TaxID=1293975 RepID=A0AA88X9V6_9ASTE|nr:hypothetical protein RJ639_001876 [Escallonia herrerae]
MRVQNSLLAVYAKCGRLSSARSFFDGMEGKDSVSWNSIITGYCRTGEVGEARRLFELMAEEGNGDEDEATDLFQRMEKDGTIKRDTASWNALIAGYLQNGQKNKALGVFRQMQSLGVTPNSVTILSILPACANLVAAKKVREIQCCVLRRNLDSEMSVLNSLIDTYAKAGNVVYSKSIFDRLLTKDIISWNTMMTGFVLHGCSGEALALYDRMRQLGIEPNRGTFVPLISAYGLAKLVNEGERVFSSMTEDYNIIPYLDHCAAMVEIYGRSGRLEEAVQFIEDMAIEPETSIWGALLIACMVHGNIRLAVLAGERLHELEPGNAMIQHLILQTNALGENPEDSVKVKSPDKRNDTKHSLGQSWMERKNVVHSFVAGDHRQPDAEVLYSWIKSTIQDVKRHDSCDGLCIHEEEKEKSGWIHSEKLAFAFALIDSPRAPQSIRIVKNLRMCEDCHRTAKYISKEFECEIYLNDSKSLHHFRDGHCSCGDYW